MSFFNSVVSAVVGAVAAVANAIGSAVKSIVSAVSGIASSAVGGIESAASGAMATLGVVDVDEDGEFDIDDVEEFLEEKFKLLVGASVDGMKKVASMAKGCLDGFQTVLDVAGLVPGFGEFADGANGVIYTLRGDAVNAGLSFAACIPFLGDVTTGAKLAKKGSKYVKEVPELIDKADDVYDLTKGVTQAETKPLVNGPYIKNGKPKGRPNLSGEKKLQFEKDVYNDNVDLDGILRDPNTGDVINWKPGQSRKNVVDFGHKSGYSYKDMFQKYRNGEITLDELKEFQFNPNNYRLETPSANRSHKYE